MSSTNIYKNLLAQLDRVFRHNRQGSYKTRERYYKAMKRLCLFLAEDFHLEKLANIAPKHIHAYTDYMKNKGLSASTIKTDLAAIRFWHDMTPETRHRLPDNDRLDLERRSFGQVDRTWSGEEYARMLGICRERGREDYAALLCLARYAGLRIHECFRVDTAIAENAVRAMEITIKGKGGKIRTVPIGTSVRLELEKMLRVTERGHKLFVPDGIKTHRAINNFQRFISAHRHAARDEDSDRPMTFHGLRHTYAQERYRAFLAAGCTEGEARLAVSRLLGHEREDVTRVYLAGL